MASSPIKPNPFVQKQLGVFQRIKFFLQVWAIKAIVATLIKLDRLRKSSKVTALLPDYTKRYPERPGLQHRVFLPPGAASDSGRKFPLFITIHGGGYTLCDPQIDDEFNRLFSSTYGFLVVSINYRLAPRNPFPDAVHDTAAIIRAVLNDTTLPIDHSNISIGGFSAGGNITLAVAQLPGIHERVHNLVPFYPATDFTRQTRGPFVTTKDGKEDVLKSLSPLFDWAYISPGTDRADPLLSVTLAGRDKIPHRVFFVTAECDMLCREAGVMAKRLAGFGDDEDLGSDWEKDGVKWRMVPGVQHGWNQMELQGEDEVARRKGLDVLYKDIADWLRA